MTYYPPRCNPGVHCDSQSTIAVFRDSTVEAIHRWIIRVGFAKFRFPDGSFYPFDGNCPLLQGVQGVFCEFKLHSFYGDKITI